MSPALATQSQCKSKVEISRRSDPRSSFVVPRGSSLVGRRRRRRWEKDRCHSPKVRTHVRALSLFRRVRNSRFPRSPGILENPEMLWRGSLGGPQRASSRRTMPTRFIFVQLGARRPRFATISAPSAPLRVNFRTDPGWTPRSVGSPPPRSFRPPFSSKYLEGEARDLDWATNADDMWIDSPCGAGETSDIEVATHTHTHQRKRRLDVARC